MLRTPTKLTRTCWQEPRSASTEWEGCAFARYPCRLHCFLPKACDSLLTTLRCCNIEGGDSKLQCHARWSCRNGASQELDDWQPHLQQRLMCWRSTLPSLLQCIAMFAPGAKCAVLHLRYSSALCAVAMGGLALLNFSGEHGTGFRQNIPCQSIIFFCAGTYQAGGKVRVRVTALVCCMPCRTT